MLHTHKTYRNDPPTERRVLFFVSVPASYPHGLLLFGAVKRFASTKRSVHRGDLAESDLHRIISIRNPIRRWDALALFRKLVFVQSDGGNGEASKAAPPGRLRPSGWRYEKQCSGGSICAFLCANAPLPRGSPEGPARRPVPWGCFFRPFLCRNKEMGIQKTIAFLNLHFMFSKQKLTFIPPTNPNLNISDTPSIRSCIPAVEYH